MNFCVQYSEGFFCIYTVLIVLKGTGIIKPNLWCYMRGPAQFFLVHMVSLHSLPAGACCRKIIFMKENRVLTFHIHLICALCSGISRFSFITKNKANITSVSDHQTAAMQEGHRAFTVLGHCALLTQKPDGLFRYQATQRLLFAFQLR